MIAALGQPFEIREYPCSSRGRDDPIKILLANVCGSDIQTYCHDRDAAMKNIPYPTIQGHEMVGTIDALGEGARADSDGKSLKLGDRVVLGYALRDCRTLGPRPPPARRPGARVHLSLLPHHQSGISRSPCTTSRGMLALIAWAASTWRRSVLSSGVPHRRHRVNP